MRTRYISLLVILLVGLFAVTAQAGDPDSPGGPASTTSYTLDDLYNRLRDGTAGSPRPFTEPTNGPGSRTMHTLDELMDVAPAPDGANGATSGQVLSGTTYWSLRGENWGTGIGTMPDRGAILIVPGVWTKTIPSGYHNGGGVVRGDQNLRPANIMSGAAIFGVEGTALEASGVATAGQVLTGVSFSSADGPAVGSMPDNGALLVTPTTRTVTIPAGYHNGGGLVVGDGDLQPGNILSGTTLFEVEGTALEASGVATTGQVLTGASFSNANDPAVGAMPNNGAIFVTPTTKTVTIPSGYHNGGGLVSGDPDLQPGNILSGTTLFEVDGTALEASGVATTGQVLTGVSFSNANGPAVGAMPNNGALFVTPTTETVTIPAGYHNGGGLVVGDGDLQPGNILSGTTLFEVEGAALEASGVATTGQVLTGVSFSNAAGAAMGSMPNNGAIFVTPTTKTVTIPSGYHNGGGLVSGDPDLQPGNILSGTTLFEVEGTALEASGEATTGQVLTGVSFSNAAGAAMGSMPNNGAIFVTPTTRTVAIPAGYHNGSGLVVGDGDLQPGNILSGTAIFEVEGAALEASGVAMSGQVLTGVSFSNADGPAVGSMPDNGAISVTPTTETVTIPAGYHNGGGSIFGDSDLVSGNILSGTTIFEVEGTALEVSGAATTGQVLTGVSFSNADGPAVGSMPDNGAISVTPTTETVTIPAGYHNGSGSIFGDGDLVSGNILSGTTIFEVEGTALEASGAATTGQVLTGVSFSNANGPAVGSMPDNGALLVTPTTRTVTIPAGYHNGSGLVSGDLDLVSGNILSGTAIFEVEGTALEASGAATTGQVLTGVSFSNADGPAVGSMPDNGAISVMPTTRTVTIPAGYHNGGGSIFGDGDLVSGNILNSANIFGINGSVIRATGVATSGQVLSGVAFSNASGAGIGGMPDNGTVVITPSTVTVPIALGFHDGSGLVIGDADLKPANIVSGMNIFGINGSAIRATGLADPQEVLAGVSFSNAGGAATGSMPDRGAVTITPATTAQTIAAGYHNGSGSVVGDSDLTAGNILTGKNIFGISGSVIKASGSATAGQVLTGISFSNAGGAVTGSMPDRGAVTITPTTTAQTIAAGYHNGSGSVIGDSDLVAGNILTGKNIFGINGSVIQASGVATAGQVLTGISFSNASGATTGSMPNRGAVTITPTTTAQTIAAGYHNGSGSVVGDSDLTAGNILTGKNIFGVNGSVIQASGSATAGQVLTGISFSNAGGAATGTMPDRGAVIITPTTTAQTIAAGYHSGSGSVVGDSDLIAGNILTGKNIFGVNGSVIQATGVATAGQVLTGISFSNAGGAVTGSMPNRGAVTITPTTTAQTIVAGYHNGSGLVIGDPELVAGNILGGISIFGVNGSITNRGAVTITPTTTAQTIAAGYHSGSGSVVGDSDLIAGNILTGKNIFGISGSVIQASGVATAGQVLTGISFSNAGGAVTGSMPNRGAVTISPSSSQQAIPIGYHNGSGLVSGDADLVATKILSGVNIFGVTGTYPVAAVAKTGVTKNIYPNDDAQLQRGVSWPVPRFTNNGNGTVTDNLTGLVWLRDPICAGSMYGLTISDTFTSVAKLNSGECGLTDGSVEGDWRLPNVREFDSLLCFAYMSPALCNTLGTGQASEGNPFVSLNNYKNLTFWTSTPAPILSSYYLVSLQDGIRVKDGGTDNSYYAWPVRDK